MNCLSLGEAIMLIIARRIARLYFVDPGAAEADYLQHVSAMSADEIEMFQDAIVKFAVNGKGARDE